MMMSMAKGGAERRREDGCVDKDGEDGWMDAMDG